jgi:fructose/tagatose bisphosphate aldolase
MRHAYRITLEQALADNKTEYAVVKLMDKVIASVQEVVESKIDMFNSSGKAQPK